MAHTDLNVLSDHLITLAQQMLEEHGGFPPFGAAVASDGKLHLYAADNGQSSRPLIEVLTAQLRSLAAERVIRASGICFGVVVKSIQHAKEAKEAKENDAIQCRLEHSDGEGTDVFLLYSKSPSGEIRYDDLRTTQLERCTRSVFPNLQ